MLFDHTLTTCEFSLQRTVQTAAYVNSAERCQIPTLNEIDSGKLDGLTYEEFADKYPEEFQGREDDKLRFRYPEGIVGK